MCALVTGVQTCALPICAAWKTNERPISPSPRQVLLTHDKHRYDDEMWWKAQQPDLVTGPPRWQWLARAFGSTTALAADPRLARLDIPLLMLLADSDTPVDPRVARRLAARPPDCTALGFGAGKAYEVTRAGRPGRARAIAPHQP